MKGMQSELSHVRELIFELINLMPQIFLEPVVKLQEYFPLYHLSSPSYQFQVFLSFQKLFDDCNISKLKQDKFNYGSRIYRIELGSQFRGAGN